MELSIADQKTCQEKGDVCQVKNCSHDCIVIDGEAKCICDDGYVLENDSSCVDINECLDFLHCSHDCVNEDGSFFCSCPKGMIILPDKRSCVESDCDLNICPHGCISNHPIQCACPEGFVENITKCKDIDECFLEIDTCSHLCRNLNGSFECYCYEGFFLDEDQETCIDINECEDNACHGHHCVNTEGNFSCECALGYNFSLTTKHCEDINECNIIIDEGNNVCSHICTNTLGSFICDCPKGFSIGRDMRTCYDINECQETNEIGRKCSHHCVNEIGGYHCECPEGFVLSKDGHLCSKLSHCSLNNGGCSDICMDVNGFSFCECPEWKVLSSDNATCLSPCLFDNNGCSQICDELTGSCSCDVGFKINDDLKSCDDIKEYGFNNGNLSDSLEGPLSPGQNVEEHEYGSSFNTSIPEEDGADNDEGEVERENEVEITEIFSNIKLEEDTRQGKYFVLEV